MKDMQTVTIEICNEICTELSTAVTNGTLGNTPGQDLFGGVLLNRYLYMAEPKEKYIQDVDRYTNMILATVGQHNIFSLYGGVTGVGWLLSHLARLDGDTADVDDLNRVLLTNLSRPWSGVYDIVGGLAGIAIYACECQSEEDRHLILASVVKQLESMISVDRGGRSWFTPSIQIPPSQIEHFPNGYYNLGFAHGAPGVIRILSEAVSCGVEVESACTMLDESVPWLLSHLEQGDFGWSLQSNNVVEHNPSRRLAWCYNELGAMIAVVSAGIELGQPKWIQKAQDVIDSTLGTTIEESRVRDAGLCHGAAGVGHLYSWFGSQLNNERYLTEAQRWMESIMDFRECEFPGGFYKIGTDPQTDKFQRQTCYSFLDGSCGVGLAMLSHWFSIPCGWNRLLGM